MISFFGEHKSIGIAQYRRVKTIANARSYTIRNEVMRKALITFPFAERN
jgi:hypothetical protein